ncbi:NAD(P)/FAD-dependent oxidoreductase [Rhizobium leguminosarum]|uniref:NAD(P)/FAD-dependent oxidoreductase n=1 Tax=Rhizobium leguminosarum TaxID=384 RepID=UPI0021BBE4B3|nr:FAD-dependent oxidoreductase [Rhizobium leguminosarum]
MNAKSADPPYTLAVSDAVQAGETRAQKRIVIAGGGFVGVAAARALERADAEVVLIDRRNHHIFQPLLYQAAPAVLAQSEIAAPIRQLAVKQRNLTVMLAEVTSVDLSSRTVDADCPGLGTRKVPFDHLLIATGMRPSYFGHDEFAPALKDLNDAETIRSKILRAFELAETTDDASARARQMTFVLIGAGPTGVELAASMAHMAATTLRKNFRRIDPANSTIILLEGGNRVLPAFAETLSRKATARLEKLGVKVMTGVKVEKVDEQGVVAGGKRISSATVLTKPPSALGRLKEIGFWLAAWTGCRDWTERAIDRISSECDLQHQMKILCAGPVADAVRWQIARKSALLSLRRWVLPRSATMRPSNGACSEGRRCSTCVLLTSPPSTSLVEARLSRPKTGCQDDVAIADCMLETAYYPSGHNLLARKHFEQVLRDLPHEPPSIAGQLCSTRDSCRSCASRAHTGWSAISIASSLLRREDCGGSGLNGA